MNRLFRRTTLALLALLLAAALLFWPFGATPPANLAVPRSVPAGDQEIVWLNAATSAVAWERFVAAVGRLQADRPELGLEMTDDGDPFPSQTTAVPELVVRLRGKQGRLWFRWYKLTSDLGNGQWVQALAQRQPPPLAIIGGSTSDRAWELARELAGAPSPEPAPPLLLLTNATADMVGADDDRDRKVLMQIYPERTFRFCFTNSQMAEAVTDFVWSQPELRPDGEPVYLVYWKDDPYSEDLFDRFHEGLAHVLQRAQAAKTVARDWSWLARRLVVGGVPPGLDLEGLRRVEALESPRPFWNIPIPYSLGTYTRPNRWEEDAAEKLMNEFSQHPTQHRPLLVLPANPQPARRFLRGLIRTAPIEAGRFVVVTGDSLDFNTLYRDRMLAWPIQDLPFALVAFCHRNPVDPEAFQPDQPGQEDVAPDPTGRTSTGTHDLLLYRDIIRTVLAAAYPGDRLIASADTLRDNLRQAQFTSGRHRFDAEGNRLGGAGEYVVWLQPLREGDRILPKATLQIWHRIAAGNAWKPVTVDKQPKLLVDYARETRVTRLEEAP